MEKPWPPFPDLMGMAERGEPVAKMRAEYFKYLQEQHAVFQERLAEYARKKFGEPRNGAT